MRPTLTTRLTSALTGLALSAWLLLPAPLAAQSAQDELPDMGTAAQSTLSLEDEYRIGRMVMRNLRESGTLLEDPEVGEYLQSLGLRLSSLAHDGNRDFNFFLVRDRTINAFALPGGFIGIHSGLLLETAEESELAAVFAHEVAHVTQRHIARGLENQGRASLVSTAATLAAILLGALGGIPANATMGAVTAAQNLAVQSQISFTRENEYEADRVGIGILTAAGFDPEAMADFFETMGRRTQLGPDQVPELLRSHPVTSARIAEARGRSAQQPAVVPRASLSYALAKERVRVLGTPSGTDPRAYYDAVIQNEPDASAAQVYGHALAQVVTGDAEAAIPAITRLRDANPGVMPYHTLLGQAQLAAGHTREALATLERARALSPRNVPVTLRYAEALMQAGRPKRAHEVLLDLFNNVQPTQEQIRQTAIAANAAGDVADAYSYMAEYHIMGGDLLLAINQLELALSVPGSTGQQRAKFSARLKELREALPKERARMERPAGERPPSNLDGPTR
jgi:predicted Zn-dependent protease